MTSLETWAGALYYAAFFPVAGWLLDTAGPVNGYVWIATIVVLTAAPLLVAARHERI
jgi:hypothetical protein